MTYSATFDRSITANYENCPLLPVLLSCTITAVTGFADKGLFVYRVDPDTAAETFSHVASACDLDSLLLDVVTDFFVRRSSMTKSYATADAATTGSAEIETYLRELCVQMNKISTLGTPETVTVSS